MCGIYGSTCFNKFKELYTSNTSRGNFANGHVFINSTAGKRSLHISKSPGVRIYKDGPTPGDVMFLGHTQSPTGSIRDYHPTTTHPFESKNWIVAHNGVINNYVELKRAFSPTSKCDVDSSVVVELLELLSQPGQNINHVVRDTLNMIKGTYGLFMYYKKQDILYVARSGSTLYCSPNDCSFSSTMSTGMVELPEHAVYRVIDGCLVSVAELANNSSFLIL